MKRIINFRPTFYIMLGMMAGIYVTYSLRIHSIIPIIISVIILGIYIVLGTMKKINYLKSIVLILALITGIFGGNIAFKSFSIKPDNYESTFIGTIDYINVTPNYTTLYIVNCKDEINNTKIKNTIIAYLYGSLYDYYIGDRISFTGELKSNDLIEEESFNDFYYTRNICYKISLTTDKINFITNKLSLMQRIRIKIREKLYSVMNDEIASISYSVFVGDKSYIQAENYEMFTKSGMAHLLAISGLHISLMCYIIKFILQKLKTRRSIIFVIITFVIIFYLFLCNFTLSAVRAGIMTSVLIFSDMTFYRYDSLSSLSFSTCLILLIKPLSLLCPSFQLSVLSVLAIILLYPQVIQIVYKLTKFNENYLIDSLCLTFSIQILTLPIIINSYRSINLISLILNTVLIPLFTIFYTLIFVLIILCTILPFISFMLKVPEFIFSIIMAVLRLTGNLSTIITFSSVSNLFAISLWLLCFVLSDYVMIKPNIRIVISTILVIVIICSLIIPYKDTKFNNSMVFIGGVTNCVMINDCDEITLVNIGNVSETVRLINFLSNANIKIINNIIITDFEFEDIGKLTKLTQNFNIKNLWLLSGITTDMEYLSARLPECNLIRYDENKNYNTGNTDIMIISTDNGTAAKINFINFTILIINTGIKNIINFQYEVRDIIDKADILKIYTYTHNFEENILKADYLIYETMNHTSLPENTNCIMLDRYFKIEKAMRFK